MNSVVQLVVSLQIWNSNNADVLLDSGLNLFNIMANLCSKLYCEVLLKSGNYIVYVLKWTSVLNFNKRGCVRQIVACGFSIPMNRMGLCSLLDWVQGNLVQLNTASNGTDGRSAVEPLVLGFRQ